MTSIPRLAEGMAWLARARSVAFLGAVGVLLGAVCLALAAVRGGTVPPEGNLVETGIFNGSLGVFLLTMAALVPLVKFSRAGYRAWLGTLWVITPYNYGIETVQAFRGYDPRFSEVAPDIDRLAGGIFFGTAVILLVCFLVLAVKLARAEATPLTVAVRYGIVASLIAFGVGLAMSVLGGRVVPESGNLLPLHGLGFHGLQAVPLIAIVMKRRGIAAQAAMGWVHVAGLSWLGLCLSVAAQAALGRNPLDVGPASIAALGLLVAWAATLGVALRAHPAES